MFHRHVVVKFVFFFKQRIAGICDVAETCGGAIQCPPDLFKDSLTICRMF